MRGCLRQMGSKAPCQKCGKPTVWVYEGRVRCLDCLPAGVLDFIRFIEGSAEGEGERA
jgi:hypothetical protein